MLYWQTNQYPYMLWSYYISIRYPHFTALYEGKGMKVKGL